MTDHFAMMYDRKRLGFAEVVLREFEFLRATYGFRVVQKEVTFVRYESDQLFINISHGRFSYAIGVELGKLSAPEHYYQLPSLIAGLASGYTGRIFFQASESGAVQNCVAEVARVLKTYCDAALVADDEALCRVEAAAKAASNRATLDAQYGSVIYGADKAWEAKNLQLAMTLYEKAEPVLDETQARRLAYLRKKIS